MSKTGHGQPRNISSIKCEPSQSECVNGKLKQFRGADIFQIRGGTKCEVCCAGEYECPNPRDVCVMGTKCVNGDGNEKFGAQIFKPRDRFS